MSGVTSYHRILSEYWLDSGNQHDAFKMVLSKGDYADTDNLIEISAEQDDGSLRTLFARDKDGVNRQSSVTDVTFTFEPDGYETSTQNNAVLARAELDFQGAAGFASVAGVWASATGHGSAGMTASGSAYLQGGVFFAKRGGAADVANTGSFYMYGQNCVAQLSADAKGNVGSCIGAFFASRVRSHVAAAAFGAEATVTVGVYDSVNASATDVRGHFVDLVFGKASGNVTTVGTSYGLHLSTTVNATATVTTRYANYQVSSGDMNYFAGKTGFGTNAPSQLVDVNDDSVRIRVAKTPATASAAGTQGQFAWDANYFYQCVATNTWKRAALSTW